jgi:CxxC-x17-CxxC domain-containing protein
MKDFNKGGFRKERGDFGGRPKFGNKFGGGKFGGGFKKFGGPRGGKPFGDREMFDATCSSCGKPCQVPFRPTGEKPVFCRDCFAKQEPAPWRNDNRPPRFERPPRDARPSGGGDIDGLKYRIQSLENKVDRLLEIVSGGKKESAPLSKAEEKPEAPKKEKKAKKTAKPKK